MNRQMLSILPTVIPACTLLLVIVSNCCHNHAAWAQTTTTYACGDGETLTCTECITPAGYRWSKDSVTINNGDISTWKFEQATRGAFDVRSTRTLQSTAGADSFEVKLLDSLDDEVQTASGTFHWRSNYGVSCWHHPADYAPARFKPPPLPNRNEDFYLQIKCTNFFWDCKLDFYHYVLDAASQDVYSCLWVMNNGTLSCEANAGSTSAVGAAVSVFAALGLTWQVFSAFG